MILEGTTSSGAVVPVQVTADGKVVAEGRTGPEGPQGPEGPEGPQGPEGPAGAPGNLWSGSDPGPISYTGGSVGIGTGSPGDTLDIGTGGISLSSQSSGSPHPEQKIKWSNDSTTANGFYISQGPDRSGKIWHEQGLEIQFGTGNQQRMVLDYSGRLGIGAQTPGSYDAGADDLVVANSGNSGVTVVSGTSDIGSIYFADGTVGNEAYRGKIEYNHSSDSLSFGSAGLSPRATIDSSGRLLIGMNTAPAGTVTGDVVCQGAVILQSPNGMWWAIEVEDNGTLSVAQTVVR